MNMKKYIVYITVFTILAFVGCTEFGADTSQKLSSAPDAVISDVVAEENGDSITFTIAPAADAGYYAWLLVQSETVDSTLAADRILRQQIDGQAKGIANYAEDVETIVGVGGLKPFTVYQIYAVASTTDGVVSEITNATIRTLDDGSKPTPEEVELSDSTIISLTFHEPIVLGSGKVFVSYFAKNTVSGSNPLVITAGYEKFNMQDVEINADSLSVDGNDLNIKLSAVPHGAYISVTYEAGAVLDIEGNACNAFVNKADTLVKGEPSRGITIKVSNESWKIYSEFEALNPDTLAGFSDWTDFSIPVIPDSNIVVVKENPKIIPTVIYTEPNKSSTIKVETWGISNSDDLEFLLPEEPVRGAIVDLKVPEGAFEDPYGNSSKELVVKGNYIYSYGYTMDDVIGTYDITMNSYFDGPTTESSIIIDKIIR